MSTTIDIAMEMSFYSAHFWNALSLVSTIMGFALVAALLILGRVPGMSAGRKKFHAILTTVLMVALAGGAVFTGFRDMHRDIVIDAQRNITEAVWMNMDFYYMPTYVVKEAWDQGDWVEFSAIQIQGEDYRPEMFEIRMDKEKETVEVRRTAG